MPWGADNQMPYDIIDKVEADETMSTCMKFAVETFYSGGLEYQASENTAPDIVESAEEFCEDNNLPGYFMGVATDMKYFGFAVTVLILSKDRRRIVSIDRKEACYCRFTEAEGHAGIRHVCYYNWRDGAPYDESAIEVIPLLDESHPLRDLRERVESLSGGHKFAVVTRVPTVDSTYYPIPWYGSIFRSKWYDIKQLIAIAKESKLRNTAPIKYQIEISDRYWQDKFKELGLTDHAKRRKFVNEEKERIIDFLTGAENSGKAIFSSYKTTPDGREIHDVVIKKVDTATQGGDWATDIQEAINMVCFTMGVHSNLVGSVPGKGQSNNSGSDKRELYTIAQATQKPYRDLLFAVHRMIIRYNGWRGIKPVCPLLQLTTLDEHRDIKVGYTSNQ
ncbi:MAG: hypothetical protein K2H86_07730 [Muribaculaceae bacterium]|nr:hypothetical protein [Muribaculaceae bacterium]